MRDLATLAERITGLVLEQLSGNAERTRIGEELQKVW